MGILSVGYLSKEIFILYTDKGRAGARYVLPGPILHAAAITELQIMLATILVSNTI
jgi:hypothetical protein